MPEREVPLAVDRFWTYCGRIRQEVNQGDEAKWGRDNLAFALIVSLLVSVAYSFSAKAPLDLLSIATSCGVFGCCLLFFVLAVYARAPWKLHQRQQVEIEALATFKKEVEDQEVHLVLREHHTKTVTHRFPDAPDEKALALRVIFQNARVAGMPGKIAKQVAAKIDCVDSRGKQVRVAGRWAQMDQPETLGKFKSKLSLLRIDFDVGSELELDIAAKFSKDALPLCYAIDNDCFPDVRHERTALVGSPIKVHIELVAEHVHQFFELELENTVGSLRCTLARELPLESPTSEQSIYNKLPSDPIISGGGRPRLE